MSNVDLEQAARTRAILVEKFLAKILGYIILAGVVCFAAVLFTGYVKQSPGFHVATQVRTPTVGDLASYMPVAPKLNAWGIFSIAFAWLLAVAVTLRSIHGIISSAVRVFTREKPTAAMEALKPLPR